jgi:hypothetical protein
VGVLQLHEGLTAHTLTKQRVADQRGGREMFHDDTVSPTDVVETHREYAAYVGVRALAGEVGGLEFGA